MQAAVRGTPLHHAADSGKVHRTNDPAITECVAVAVLKVRHGRIVLVADERNRTGIATERRARERKARTGANEGMLERCPPGTIFAAVVDFIENDKRAVCQMCQGVRIQRDLLVRRHDAVDIRRDDGSVGDQRGSR